MTKEIISTKQAAPPGGVYSQGVAGNGLVFTAGQVARTPQGESAGSDIRSQTRQVLENLRAVLEAGGAGLDTVVKTTCFLADIGDFAAFNEVYKEFFPTDPPARSTFQVVLLPGWVVEIEAIALRR